MSSKARSSLGVVRLEMGRIVSVDFENHVARVRSESSEQYMYNVPIMSPYMNQTLAQGIKWLPQGGEVVIMAVLSDGERRILGYTGVIEDGSHNYGFGEMNGGDFSIRGGNGSFLRMRSGGVIELGSTSICSSIYIPTRNITHHISENWLLDTFAGSLEFKTDRAEDNDDGHVPTYMSLNIKQFADDENEMVRLKVGGGQDDLAFSLVIKDSGNGENVKANISLNKNGDLSLSLERDLKMNIKGKVQLSSTGDLSLESKGSFSQKADQDMSISGNTVKISSNSSMDLSASSISLKSSNIRISNSALYPIVRLSPELISLLSAVSAVVKVPLTSTHFNATVLT